MTELNVLSVEEGAYYDNIAWDFWVNAYLKDGRQIKLFDPQAIDLREFIGSTLFVKIKSLFVQKKPQKDLWFFEGTINECEGSFIFKNETIEIQVNQEDLLLNQLLVNEKCIYYFGRLDILTVTNRQAEAI